MAETIGLDVHPRAGAAVLARAMVLLDGLGLDSAALERSQRTTTVVAAGLAALEATGARDPAVLRRAFEACFEGRPDVSIVQSALLRSLHLDNAVPTFFQKVKDVIFPPGQPIVAVAPAILTRSQRTAQLMAALPHPPRVLDVGIKQILLLQGGLSSTIVGRGPVRPERDPPLAKANYARAIDFVIARAKDPRRPSLRDLVEINRLILANVVFPGRVAGGLAGRMRPGEIYAGNPRAGTVRHYAEQREIVPLLTMFRTWLEANLTEMRNGNVPPEAIACEAYRRLVAIHPFADGNGRTTRLMANLILLSAGRPPAALSTGEICPPDVHASAPSVYRGDSYMDAYAAAVQRSAMLLGRPKQHRLASRVVAQAAPAA